MAANRIVLWLSASSGALAEALALDSQADGLVVDNQHGQFGTDYALSLVAAAIGKNPKCQLSARISEVGDAEICKFMDAGVSVLIAPMINSKEQCLRFVSACRYPPLGVRSFGPYRQKSMIAGGFTLAAANALAEPLAM